MSFKRLPADLLSSLASRRLGFTEGFNAVLSTCRGRCTRALLEDMRGGMPLERFREGFAGLA